MATAIGKKVEEAYRTAAPAMGNLSLLIEGGRPPPGRRQDDEGNQTMKNDSRPGLPELASQLRDVGRAMRGLTPEEARQEQLDALEDAVERLHDQLVVTATGLGLATLMVG